MRKYKRNHILDKSHMVDAQEISVEDLIYQLEKVSENEPLERQTIKALKNLRDKVLDLEAKVNG